MDEIDGRLVGGLMVLAAVADARYFGKAAERLGMTQSGVSKAMAKLEARLGARLIHRTSRAVALTEEGRALQECGNWRGGGRDFENARDGPRQVASQCRSAVLARGSVPES